MQTCIGDVENIVQVGLWWNRSISTDIWICSCIPMPAIAVPLGRAKAGFWGGLGQERQVCTELWASLCQKPQKNASIFTSVGGTVSFHVDLLLATVPGTATSQSENFIFICYINVCELWIAHSLHRTDAAFPAALRSGIYVVGLLSATTSTPFICVTTKGKKSSLSCFSLQYYGGNLSFQFIKAYEWSKKSLQWVAQGDAS